MILHKLFQFVLFRAKGAQEERQENEPWIHCAAAKGLACRESEQALASAPGLKRRHLDRTRQNQVEQRKRQERRTAVSVQEGHLDRAFNS